MKNFPANTDNPTTSPDFNVIRHVAHRLTFLRFSRELLGGILAQLTLIRYQISTALARSDRNPQRNGIITTTKQPPSRWLRVRGRGGGRPRRNIGVSAIVFGIKLGSSASNEHTEQTKNGEGCGCPQKPFRSHDRFIARLVAALKRCKRVHTYVVQILQDGYDDQNDFLDGDKTSPYCSITTVLRTWDGNMGESRAHSWVQRKSSGSLL